MGLPTVDRVQMKCKSQNRFLCIYYTFGYKRNDDGKVRIYLHHSSVPYSP